MSLKLRLGRRAKALREKEFGSGHPFSHWFLVILINLLRRMAFLLIGLLVFIIGYILFYIGISWLQMIIGLPLILIGGSIIIISFYQLLAVVFDRYYSKTHCPLCHPNTPSHASNRGLA